MIDDIDALENIQCFPTTVYSIKKPEFYASLHKIAIEALEQINQDLNEIYPVKMSGDFSQHPEVQEFCQYTAVTSLNVLKEQGYNVNNKGAYFESMWCQEHHKFSQMDQHVHNNGVQIVGFYFLDVPKNSCYATFHDPRAGKVQIGFEEQDMARVTYASSAFHLTPEPGTMILTNSWLPHSFTKNGSDKPFRFIHFNISLTEKVSNENGVEII